MQLEIDAKMIEKLLEEEGGFFFFFDKSDPEAIKREFGLSKASFKRAIGHLLKTGKIRMMKDGIEKK